VARLRKEIACLNAYDNNGNLRYKVLSGSYTWYTWDWNNRLLAVSAPGGNTSYQYDGDDNRTSKTQNGVKTKYINDVALSLVQVLTETDDAGNIEAGYTYGQGLISMNRAGSI
jgi:YD repeat-containing protein